MVHKTSEKPPIFSKFRLSAHRSSTQKLQKKKKAQVQNPSDLVSEPWTYWQEFTIKIYSVEQEN